ncbi:glutamate--tRNA ligase [candidate division TM6 bacterium RIFCSPHIGHO2_12_FULL_36_22]|nr:MAG: glutamate--tRNA ligase [candidate division TM6 bacterium RIFCSPHIGHO2_12_FULL_36_22]
MSEIRNIQTNEPIRVRFAPSPTGIMHLGNIRTALMNFLFARQKNGIFVLRIEDTDPQRDFDPEGRQIIQDLEWLGLSYDEGPHKGGPYAPYYQSQRSAIYQEQLNVLIKNKSVYRCFCTTTELETKRQRQITLKQPPRYDQTCYKLSKEAIADKLAIDTPFIWRFHIDQNKKAEFKDLGHGNMSFDLVNFSDFPLTRQDGSFTFIFANCVDDIAMKINYVFRGDDHTSNTVNQVVLYQAFNAKLPIYWHMPIICNLEGKKLSKREFGFSLRDLREAGFLSEAINNYLSIIGASFENEILTLDEIIAQYNFDNISSANQIKYDVEKLRWINHKWIGQLDTQELLKRCMPILEKNYSDIAQQDHNTLLNLIALVQTDLVTLNDVVPAVRFYFIKPVIASDQIQAIKPNAPLEKISKILSNNLELLKDSENFLKIVTVTAKEAGIKLSDMMPIIRMILTGSPQGPHIGQIITILGWQEAEARFQSYFG